MKFLASSIPALILTMSFNAFADTKVKTCTFDVQGMTCAACATTLKLGIKKIDGVTAVKASTETKNAEVSFDPSKTDQEKIKDAIDRVGYKATLNQCKA